MDFITDIRDLEFVLFEYLGLDKLAEFEKWQEFDLETFRMVLEEASKMATQVLGPINASGDEEGVKLTEKGVVLPKGFKQAYDQYCDNGWLGISCPPEWGGQGFPETLGLAVGEMFVGANCSFSMTPGLTRGAANLVYSYGTDEQKELFLEKMYTGQWAGTMCLTEPQAGSAVGDVRTMATPNDDGSYSIIGTKIFITSGDHDLTENIVHPVLARMPDAPPGIKGISLFLVPKVRVNADGSLGEPNDIVCTNIEHKMGIHASPTCTLNFGDNNQCKGYLLGEPHKGIVYMFQMMNEARIGVGMQGIAQAAPAYQLSLKYAKERVQGVDVLSFKDPNAERIAIINHPDVKRMLMEMKAYVEGGRALLLSAAYFSDQHHVTGDSTYMDLIDLLTPICKAYCTDVAFRVTELAIQVHGGYGYTAEYGVEQYMRDVKISSIYEGTNGIQALDLVGRKLGQKGGVLFMTFLNRINLFVDSLKGNPQLGDLAEDLDNAKNKLAEVTMTLGMKGKDQPIYPVCNATPYLSMFGDVTFAYFLLDMAVTASAKLDALYADKGATDPAAKAALHKNHDGAAFYYSKIQTARFFIKQMLPLVYGKARAILTEDMCMLDVPL